MAVLGEVPGQGIVYRQGGLVQGESTSIREQARELGLSQKDLAQRVGVSAGYMSDVCRGRRNMSPAVQARVEKVLGGQVEIAPARVRKPPGGPGERGDHLHPGACPREGHEPQGPGGAGRGVLRLPDPGLAGPAEHGSCLPVQDRGGAGRPGQGRGSSNSATLTRAPCGTAWMPTVTGAQCHSIVKSLLKARGAREDAPGSAHLPGGESQRGP